MQSVPENLTKRDREIKLRKFETTTSSQRNNPKFQQGKDCSGRIGMGLSPEFLLFQECIVEVRNRREILISIPSIENR